MNTTTKDKTQRTDKQNPALVILENNAELPPVWGHSGVERIRRAVVHMGATLIAEEELASLEENTPVICLRADYVYHIQVLQGIYKSAGVLLQNQDGQNQDGQTCLGAHLTSPQQAQDFIKYFRGEHETPPTNLTTQNNETIGNKFDSTLRKKENLFCHKIDPATLAATEKEIFASTYKGVTDVITKYVWPWPARHVTKFCCENKISPFVINLAGIACVLAATYFFWQGEFAIGLVFGWIFAFFDTVDGKLARTQLLYSELGHALDHGTDLIHPPFWYVAWVLGLHQVGMGLEPTSQFTLIGVIVLGYIFQRMQEGYFIMRFGMHLHIWRRFDSFFRLITTRRNPNLIIMTVFLLAGRPDLAAYGIGLWTLVSVGVHMEQIISAEILNLRGKEITSWLSL